MNNRIAEFNSKIFEAAIKRGDDGLVFVEGEVAGAAGINANIGRSYPRDSKSITLDQCQALTLNHGEKKLREYLDSQRWSEKRLSLLKNT